MMGRIVKSYSSAQPAQNEGTARPAFPVLPDSLDPSCKHFILATDLAQQQVDKLNQLTSLCHMGGEALFSGCGT